MRCEELLRDKAWSIIRKEALDLSAGVCTIRPAALSERIGDAAALTVAVMKGQQVK